MSKNLLHVNKLKDFKAFLDRRLIAYKRGNGPYQILRIVWKGKMYAIYRREKLLEHYTVDRRIDWLIREFIDETNSPNTAEASSRSSGTMHDASAAGR